MEKRIHLAWALLACMFSFLLTACGGGGGGDAAQSNPENTSPSWHVATLAQEAMQVVPGGGYSEYLDIPTLDLLQRNGSSSIYNSLTYDRVSGWGQVTQMASSFTNEALNTTSRSARAGSWLLVSWSGSSGTYIRLTGPSIDSGAVLLSSSVINNQVALAVTASGLARVAWLDAPNFVREKLIRTGHFNGGSWVVDASVATAELASEIFANLSGPDGNGWLIYGQNHVYSRSFDVVTGLGNETRVDDPALSLGTDVGQVIAHKDGTGITVSMEVGSQGCIATRRFNGASWGSIACINAGIPVSSFSMHDLVTTATGKAMLVWAGFNHDTFHVVTRANATAAWSTPATINTTGVRPNNLQAALDEDGHAAVAFYGFLSDQRAPFIATSSNGLSWTTPVIPGYVSGQPWNKELLDLVVRLGENGEPALLALFDTGSFDNVEFTQRGSGSWATPQVLQTNVQIARTFYPPGGFQVDSRSRLVYLGNQRWAAFWEIEPLDGAIGHQAVAARFD